jgi:hypothetical protein
MDIAGRDNSKRPKSLTEFQQKMKIMLERIHKESSEFTERTGGHPPVLILIREDELEAIDFRKFIEDKQLMASMIKAYQNQDHINGTILLTEAWVLAIDAEPDGSLPPTDHLIPSESPDRKEVLFYMVETRLGNVAAQANMIRDGDKLTIGPLELLTDEGNSFQGRFVGGSFED